MDGAKCLVLIIGHFVYGLEGLCGIVTSTVANSESLAPYYKFEMKM